MDYSDYAVEELITMLLNERKMHKMLLDMRDETEADLKRLKRRYDRLYKLAREKGIFNET